MASRLIANARILDGTGRQPFAGSVRIDAPRITEVSPDGALHEAPAPPRSA